MINLQDLKPGDQFTRTYTNPTRRPALCTVREVEFTPDRPDRVRVIYTRNEPNGFGAIGPFNLCLHKDGTARLAYDTDKVGGTWSIDGWTPVTDPSDLSPGDVVRAETNPAHPYHGTRGPIEGTIAFVRDRVRMSSPDHGGRAYVFRNWNWEKRVTGAVPLGSSVTGAISRETWDNLGRISHETEALPQYPSIHHLRAAVFDIAMANRESGVWCSDVFDVLHELSIINRHALYPADVTKDQEQLIDQLVTQLREVSDDVEGQGARSLALSLDEAWAALGIPRVLPPATQRMTVEVEVPASWTQAQLHATLNQQADINIVEES